jgi:hypothetical protein
VSSKFPVPALWGGCYQDIVCPYCHVRVGAIGPWSDYQDYRDLLARHQDSCLYPSQWKALRVVSEHHAFFQGCNKRLDVFCSDPLDEVS